MDYDDADPRELLERLVQDSVAVIPSKGYFSTEFQCWHAAAIRILCDRFSEDGTLYQEFRHLQFEWPRELLEALHQNQVQFFKSQELSNNVSANEKRMIASVLESAQVEIFNYSQEEKFQTALVRARELLRTAIAMLGEQTK